MSDEHRVHDHAPMFEELTGMLGDLPDTLAVMVGHIEKPSIELVDWNGGEIWDDEKVSYPYATFRWFDHDTEFADGTVWAMREFVVTAHWKFVKAADYDCLIIDSIQEVIGDTKKEIYVRQPK